jgi:hypothetical protein
MLTSWFGGAVAVVSVVGGAVGATVGGVVGVVGVVGAVVGATVVAAGAVVVAAGTAVVAGAVDPGAAVAAVALGLGLELPHAASRNEPAIEQMMRRAARFFTTQGYAAGRELVRRPSPSCLGTVIG